MRVIGTAGHVDHGKSTLVRALTGIDPDRLKEEKAREMTIDLGFAHFDLPGVGEVSVIDVPGHRDFIENMLAGVGGIDAVLFVVAADEGIMPQTREHLAILDLLRIPAGLIVLTKIDLVSDPDWLELVRLDLIQVTAGTVLQNAPIVSVSARTGQGLDALREAIRVLLSDVPPRPDRGTPRLSVDRVFSVSGFGTVITGTLLDGSLSVGQGVELQPTGLEARIRGLQAHGQAIERAEPGSRAAINLAGVERHEVQRGQLLTLPGAGSATLLADVLFQHLRDASRPLKHNAEVKFFCGAAECMARVRLLGDETLAPGGQGWLQLALAERIPLAKGDRFILRYPSPGETIGGGVVIDPAPRARWRRFRPEVLKRLEGLANGSINPVNEWAHQRENLIRALSGYHRAEPLRMGLAAEALRGRLKLGRGDYPALIERGIKEGVIIRAQTGEIALAEHQIRFSAAQESLVKRLLNAFDQAPYTPPSMKEAEALAGAEVVRALIERGDLLALSPDVLLRPAAFQTMVEAVHAILLADNRITLKALRDQFQTSRKYAQALLEYLDERGLTRREGDDHVLGNADWSA